MNSPLVRFLIVIVVLGAAAVLATTLLDSNSEPTDEPVENSQPEAQPDPEKRVEPSTDSTPDRTAVKADDPGPSRVEAQPQEGNYDSGTGTLAGRVVSSSGSGVANAEVILLIGEGMPGFALPGARKKTGRTTTTDRDGTYLFERLPANDNYVLVAAHPELATGEYSGQRVLEDDHQVVPDIVLGSGARVFGMVTRAGAAPVPGATVELWNSVQASFIKNEAERQPWKTTLTDSAGNYEFFNVHFNACEVVATAPGLATQSKNNASLFSQQSDREINFELRPATQIAGKVIDGQGQPVPGATIQAYQYGQQVNTGYSKGSATAGGSGAFVVDSLAEGTFRMVARAQGFSDKILTNVEGGTLNVVMEMDRRGSVSGTVVAGDSGQPVPAFQLKLRALRPGGEPIQNGPRKGFRSPEGAFTFADVDPGDYVLEAQRKDYAASLSNKFSVERGKETSGIQVVLNKGGTIKGLVVDPSGAPLSGATVQLNTNNYIYNPVVALFENWGNDEKAQVIRVRTNSDGEFLMKLVVPGTYQIEVSKKLFSTQAVNDIKVQQDQVTELGRIAVARGGSITGNCRDSGGRAFADGTVNITDASGTRQGWFTSVRPDYDGHYEIHNLPNGDYKLTLNPDKIGGKAINPLLKITYSQETEQQVRVREGQTVTVNLVLPPPRN